MERNHLDSWPGIMQEGVENQIDIVDTYQALTGRYDEWETEELYLLGMNGDTRCLFLEDDECVTYTRLQVTHSMDNEDETAAYNEIREKVCVSSKSAN